MKKEPLPDTLVDYLDDLSSSKLDFILWAVKKYDIGNRDILTRGTIPFYSRARALACVIFQMDSLDAFYRQHSDRPKTGQKFVRQIIYTLSNPPSH